MSLYTALDTAVGKNVITLLFNAADLLKAIKPNPPFTQSQNNMLKEVMAQFAKDFTKESPSKFSKTVCTALKIKLEAPLTNINRRWHAIGQKLFGREKAAANEKSKGGADKKKTAKEKPTTEEKKARKWLLKDCRLPFLDLLALLYTEGVEVTSSQPTKHSMGTFVISFRNEIHTQNLSQLYHENAAWLVEVQKGPQAIGIFALFLEAQKEAPTLLNDWYRYFYFPVYILRDFKTMHGEHLDIDTFNELKDALSTWRGKNTTHYVCEVVITPCNNLTKEQQTSIVYVWESDKNSKIRTTWKERYDTEDPTLSQKIETVHIVEDE